jgi:predicted nucleotidyltransferase
MDLRDHWPTLDELCRCARNFPDVEVWAFGSMLRSENPNDLDVLIIYKDRNDVIALRGMGLWEVTLPPVDIMAMTPDEEHHYQFIKITNARRLHPPA